MADEELKVYDYLSELKPEIQVALERAPIYQRFLFERARLSKMITAEFENSGKLTNPKILALNQTVTDLGNELMEEIKVIELMQSKSAYEVFIKPRKE